MLTFSKEKNQNHEPVSASHDRSKNKSPKANGREHPILHLQRTIGNQAVLPMSQMNSQERPADLTVPAPFGREEDLDRGRGRAGAYAAGSAHERQNSPEVEGEMDAVTARALACLIARLRHADFRIGVVAQRPGIFHLILGPDVP